MKIREVGQLIFAVVVSELAGLIGSVFTLKAIPGWYAGLTKPALNPPNWLFGPVWTVLYLLMGLSLFLVWRKPAGSPEMKSRKSHAVILFFVQLVLNTLWSIIFFGLQNPGFALLEILFLWLSIAVTTGVFYELSRPAAYLLLPYLLWVSFAVYLNFSLWRLNI